MNRNSQRQARIRSVHVLTVLSLTGLGCPAGMPTPDGPMNGEPMDEGVSFAGDIVPIFSSRCADCHTAGGFADQMGIPLRLTAAEAFDDLVNQPSVQNAGLILVTPGNAETSLLFQKVSSAAPPVGDRMPLFGSPLTSEQIGLIRDWINEGAQDN